MTSASLSVEEIAALRVLARKREADKPAPSFLEFLDHVYIQPDMDREDYDPEVEFSTKGGVKWQPWPYLVERAEHWAARESESVVKARQLGISWLAAAFALWSAQYHPYFHVAEFSVGQREARVQLARSRFIYENLAREYQRGVKFKTDEAECASGSMIIAFPSTEHTGISFTFRLVIRDEAAFHPYGAQNFAAVQPTLSAGGQFIDMSTANPKLGPSGDFHDRYWASKRGETGYTAVFIPWNVRPGRDAAWLEKQRAAFTGLPEEFDAYYPESDAAAFVARSGLVYPQFVEERYVKAAPTTWEACSWRVAGIDLGGGDPTAIVPIGITVGGHAHQYGEFYGRGPIGAIELGRYLLEWHARAPFLRVFYPPEQETVGETLRGMHLPAEAADNRRGEGLGAVSWLLDQDALTIDPSCTASIAEFPGYRWRERVDPHDRTRYATATPVDHHADAMDARRYALLPVVQALLKERKARQVDVVVAGDVRTPEKPRTLRERVQRARDEAQREPMGPALVR